MEDKFVSREKKILTILEQEIEDGEEMSAAVRHIAERLLLEEKGYASSDIRKNVVFDVTLGAETAKSSVDFVVSLDNRIGMLIKCAPGSLDSRERHIVAAARVFDALPVRYSSSGKQPARVIRRLTMRAASGLFILDTPIHSAPLTCIRKHSRERISPLE